MQQVNQLLKQPNASAIANSAMPQGLLKSQSLTPATCKEVEALKAKYQPITLMAAYNPGLEHILLTKGLTKGELANNQNAPSLAILKAAFGEPVAIEWINTLIYDFVDYCEQQQGVENSKLEECAAFIMARYYYLNMAELLLFFAECKLCKFGRIYGTIGAMRIMEMLNDYISQRNEDMSRIEREQAQAKYCQPNPDAVSYEEYLIWKHKQHGN